MQPYLIIFLPIYMTLFCFGLYYSGEKGMIGNPWKENLRSRTDRGFFPQGLAKPLWLCSACMNSIWGSIVYWIMGLFIIDQMPKKLLVFWPISVITAVAMSILLESIYSSLKKAPNGNPGGTPIIDHRPSIGAGPQ